MKTKRPVSFFAGVAVITLLSGGLVSFSPQAETKGSATLLQTIPDPTGDASQAPAPSGGKKKKKKSTAPPAAAKEERRADDGSADTASTDTVNAEIDGTDSKTYDVKLTRLGPSSAVYRRDAQGNYTKTDVTKLQVSYIAAGTCTGHCERESFVISQENFVGDMSAILNSPQIQTIAAKISENENQKKLDAAEKARKEQAQQDEADYQECKAIPQDKLDEFQGNKQKAMLKCYNAMIKDARDKNPDVAVDAEKDVAEMFDKLMEDPGDRQNMRRAADIFSAVCGSRVARSYSASATNVSYTPLHRRRHEEQDSAESSSSRSCDRAIVNTYKGYLARAEATQKLDTYEDTADSRVNSLMSLASRQQNPMMAQWYQQNAVMQASLFQQNLRSVAPNLNPFLEKNPLDGGLEASDLSSLYSEYLGLDDSLAQIRCATSPTGLTSQCYGLSDQERAALGGTALVTAGLQNPNQTVNNVGMSTPILAPPNMNPNSNRTNIRGGVNGQAPMTVTSNPANRQPYVLATNTPLSPAQSSASMPYNAGGYTQNAVYTGYPTNPQMNYQPMNAGMPMANMQPQYRSM